MKHLSAFLLLLYICPLSAKTIEQTCRGDDCVQITQNTGIIQIEGRSLQIGINKGIVNIVGSAEDKAVIVNYEIKIRNLTAQINRNLVKLQVKDKRIFSEGEKLVNATGFANKLLAQLVQLNKRIAHLDEQHELTQLIINAKEHYDVPLIKQLLKEKQKLENKKIAEAAETAFELGGFQQLDLEYAEAYRNFERAVYLAPDNSLYLNEAGMLANILGQYKKAISYYLQALASDLKTYGEDHPNVSDRRNYLGLAYNSLGQYDKAIGLYQLALHSDLKTYGEDHPTVANRRNNLGGTYSSLGQYGKATPLFQLALASLQKTFGQQHPNVKMVKANLQAAKAKLKKIKQELQ